HDRRARGGVDIARAATPESNPRIQRLDSHHRCRKFLALAGRPEPARWIEYDPQRFTLRVRSVLRNLRKEALQESRIGQVGVGRVGYVECLEQRRRFADFVRWIARAAWPGIIDHQRWRIGIFESP